ncbi:MAG TPA: glycosyltransferase family 4 protein [Chroococcidiopsis sp.]
MNGRLSLVHPTSNPFARNAAIALADAGLLHEVITTTAYDPQGRLAGLLKQVPGGVGDRLHRNLARRAWAAPAGATMRSHPWREIIRVGLTQAGVSHRLSLVNPRLGYQGLIDWVYASLDRHVAACHLPDVDAIYAYEDGAAATFQAAKQQGKRCFYDLPIPFYRTHHAIQAEEAERFPELASALQALQEPAWKLARKELELQLADHIIVASSMTRRSLLAEGVPPERISVIPYGAPLDYFQPRTKSDRQFRALFVGRVGPRKGVHYLLPAWQRLALPDAELLLVGINEFPAGWLAPYDHNLRYCPSVPHASLNGYYSAASVLVLPSLMEGFGLVLLEAMACGIPVITTPNTAGPDILTDGVDGFIVPIRTEEQLAEKLEWCYRHPHELAEMGRAARRTAERWTWQRYRQALAHQVQLLMS